MTYFAHTAEDDNGRLPHEYWQLLREHLQRVAEKAAEFAQPLGLEKEAFVSGLLHDLGKYRREFQEYLSGSRNKSSATQHAIYGAAYIHYIRNGTLKSVTNAIASHHAGIHNEDGTFEQKITRFSSGKEATLILKTLHEAMTRDAIMLPKNEDFPPPDESGIPAIREELKRRFLLSCLVDADYLDTEEHFLAARGQTRPQTASSSVSTLWEQLANQIKRFKDQPKRTPLHDIRTKLAAACIEAGEASGPGIFALAAPTGSGKTINSAAFAFNHALRNNFKRVIYVIPYTSIIEQNARVFAEIFGRENVLEHHSLAGWHTDDQDESPDGLATRFRLASENWDAPFIVTTNVQFFESLHGDRPAAIRKLHRLMDAVIIFDECQTFPPKILDVTLETLRALVGYGRTSLVFCTATQPALERRPHFPFGFPELTPIIAKDWNLSTLPEFRRARFSYNPEPLTMEALAGRLARESRVLAIVNTTRTARELAKALARENPNREIYHLSARMCPAHRQAILEAIRLRLGSPNCDCILIATQLVEAGVDIDFPIVFREIGPLDSILQAGGRCNREGKLTDEAGEPKQGRVEVFHLEDSRLPPDAAYRQGTDLAAKYLRQITDGFISDEFITAYFRDLYHDSNRDGKNLRLLREEKLFGSLGREYRWIDESEPSHSILCDYGEIGAAWMAILKSQGPIPLDRRQHRAIAHYCVNLRDSETQTALKVGTLTKLPCGQIVSASSYDTRFGLTVSEANVETGCIL